MSLSTDFIPFARPLIGSEEEEAVIRVLRSGWLTTGREAQHFEDEFREYVGARYALAVNSATAGLHLAIEALGIGPGDRVAMSPYTFAATAEVARYVGADPFFVDVEEDSYNIDPVALDTAIRNDPKIRAVIPVHVSGDPCAMDEILHITTARDIPVIEDAAHAFPVRAKIDRAERFLGTVGTVGVYSFYATKTITTGEGGMIVTGNGDLARRMKLMRLHGIDREVWNRYTVPGAGWQYSVVAPGFKYNLSDISAAIGRVQLGRAKELQTRRIRIAERYDEAFRTRDYLQLPPRGSNHSWHLYILRIRPDLLKIGRDEFIEQLASAGIGTSVHFIPLHTMPYYRDRYGYAEQAFPRAMEKFRTSISLPIYPGLTEQQVDRIIQTIFTIGDTSYRIP
jgi:dTDP-4-amino-4,6-dideoxygalactose transaminase